VCLSALRQELCNQLDYFLVMADTVFEISPYSLGGICFASFVINPFQIFFQYVKMCRRDRNQHASQDINAGVVVSTD
jgi:hypothetical protein